jgi:hypothetical protein
MFLLGQYDLTKNIIMVYNYKSFICDKEVLSLTNRSH